MSSATPSRSMSLEDFRRWKVPELKAFLSKRGLGVSANKEELCALAFAAFKVMTHTDLGLLPLSMDNGL